MFQSVSLHGFQRKADGGPAETDNGDVSIRLTSRIPEKETRFGEQERADITFQSVSLHGFQRKPIFNTDVFAFQHVSIRLTSRIPEKERLKSWVRYRGYERFNPSHFTDSRERKKPVCKPVIHFLFQSVSLHGFQRKNTSTALGRMKNSSFNPSHFTDSRESRRMAQRQTGRVQFQSVSLHGFQRK